MSAEQFAVFRYEHDGAIARGWRRKLFCAVTAAGAAALTVVAFPVGALAFFVPVIGWMAGQKRLLIGPRYLICGNQILYYANVVRVSQNKRDGTLTLETAQGVRFVLERQRFSTTARKPAKIAAHKEAKFAKVAPKLAERVRRATPDTVRWW